MYKHRSQHEVDFDSIGHPRITIDNFETLLGLDPRDPRRCKALLDMLDHLCEKELPPSGAHFNGHWSTSIKVNRLWLWEIGLASFRQEAAKELRHTRKTYPQVDIQRFITYHVNMINRRITNATYGADARRNHARCHKTRRFKYPPEDADWGTLQRNPLLVDEADSESEESEGSEESDDTENEQDKDEQEFNPPTYIPRGQRKLAGRKRKRTPEEISTRVSVPRSAIHRSYHNNEGRSSSVESITVASTSRVSSVTQPSRATPIMSQASVVDSVVAHSTMANATSIGSMAVNPTTTASTTVIPTADESTTTASTIAELSSRTPPMSVAQGSGSIVVEKLEWDEVVLEFYLGAQSALCFRAALSTLLPDTATIHLKSLDMQRLQGRLQSKISSGYNDGGDWFTECVGLKEWPVALEEDNLICQLVGRKQEVWSAHPHSSTARVRLHLWRTIDEYKGHQEQLLQMTPKVKVEPQP